MSPSVIGLCDWYADKLLPCRNQQALQEVIWRLDQLQEAGTCSATQAKAALTKVCTVYLPCWLPQHVNSAYGNSTQAVLLAALIIFLVLQTKSIRLMTDDHMPENEREKLLAMVR